MSLLAHSSAKRWKRKKRNGGKGPHEVYNELRTSVVVRNSGAHAEWVHPHGTKLDVFEFGDVHTDNEEGGIVIAGWHESESGRLVVDATFHLAVVARVRKKCFPSVPQTMRELHDEIQRCCVGSALVGRHGVCTTAFRIIDCPPLGPREDRKTWQWKPAAHAVKLVEKISMLKLARAPLSRSFVAEIHAASRFPLDLRKSSLT